MARAVAECVPTKRAGLNAAASEGPAKSSPSSDSSSASSSNGLNIYAERREVETL